MPDELPDSGYDVENFDSAGEQVGSRVGQVIGSYTLYQEIGRGGMGTVYLGQHVSLDRYAAIKFLGKSLTEDPIYVDMFLREAKAAAKLNHPGIVTIYDAGCVEDGSYFMIMEYVDGTDLKTLLQEKTVFTVANGVEYILQAAAALGYAHRHQIIHRDIKPENLLLTRDGKIKVCDLGLAKRVGEDSSITQNGLVLGSPNYIAPERLRDASCNDPRMDIYSLGAAFYHLVVGKTPYHGEPAVVMASHLNDPVPDAQAANPSLSDDLSNIIKKMMAKSVDSRYQTMEQVVVELTNYKKVGVHPSSAMLKRPPGTTEIHRTGSAAQSQTTIRRAESSKTMTPQEEKAKAGIVRRTTAELFRRPKGARFNKKGAAVVVLALLIAGAAWWFLSGKANNLLSSYSSEPPLMLVDFGYAPAPGKTSPQFTSWQSSSPEPEGKCEASVARGIGEFDAAALKIGYDIINIDSRAGVKIPLDPVDATGYRKLVFRMKGHALSPSYFFVDLKAGEGQYARSGMAFVGNVGDEWESVEIPLDEFQIAPVNPLTEVAIYFGDNEGQRTRPRRGELYIQDIRLKK